MKRKSMWIAAALFILAFLVWGYAFSIDPLWPNQDMTPDMQARYEQDQKAVAELYQLGSYVMLGAVVVTIYNVIEMRRRRKEEK